MNEILKNKEQKAKPFFLTKKILITAAAVVIVVIGIVSFSTYKFAKRTDPGKASVSVLGLTSVNAGQQLTLPIIIDTKGENINAAEVYLNFNPRLLRVEKITKDNTFFKMWIQDEPKFSNDKGEISFAGGLPRPGFTGKGQVGTITVTLLKNEDAELVFTPKTRVLLNDGKATSLPITMEPIRVKVK
jgi:Cohesin domain